jgi:hypothetical protein
MFENAPITSALCYIAAPLLDLMPQLGYEPLEIIQAKSMEEVHEIKKKL